MSYFFTQPGDRAVLDAGMKAVSLDSGPPTVSLTNHKQYVNISSYVMTMLSRKTYINVFFT